MYIYLTHAHQQHPDLQAAATAGFGSLEAHQGCEGRPAHSWAAAPWDPTGTTPTRSSQSLQEHLKVRNPSSSGIISCVDHPQKSSPGYRNSPRMALGEQTQSLPGKIRFAQSNCYTTLAKMLSPPGLVSPGRALTYSHSLLLCGLPRLQTLDPFLLSRHLVHDTEQSGIKCCSDGCFSHTCYRKMEITISVS